MSMVDPMPNVLIVDDDPFVIAAYRRMLRRYERRFTLYYAGNVDEATKWLQRQEMDIVVSDLQMPGTSGETFLRDLSTTTPMVARLAISGQSDPKRELPVCCLVHQFLPKPCEPERLCAIIERIVAARSHVSDARVLAACHALTFLPVSDVGRLEFAQWMASPRTSPGCPILDQDIGLALNMLRLLSFSGGDAFGRLPSEAALACRSGLLELLLQSATSAELNGTIELNPRQQAMLNVVQESFQLAIAESHAGRWKGKSQYWFAALRSFVPEWLLIVWNLDFAEKPMAEQAADYLWKLWQIHTVESVASAPVMVY